MLYRIEVMQTCTFARLQSFSEWKPLDMTNNAFAAAGPARCLAPLSFPQE